MEEPISYKKKKSKISYETNKREWKENVYWNQSSVTVSQGKKTNVYWSCDCFLCPASNGLAAQFLLRIQYTHEKE